ncbi:MAG: MFS transporter [Muribaculaceae bacterium]|nr:MFS transporter [Muribaculaceae bacterium]
MKTRLAPLYFLQFAVWGCYLTCFGQLLGAGGLGKDIAWFYAAIGLVSILTPSLFGRMADRTRRPELLLGLCHLGAALIMTVMWRYAMTHPSLSFRTFYPLYLLFLSFYMPTMALANTASFAMMTRAGINPVTAFPPVRIWGTAGFVAAMWFVNSAYWHDGTLGFTLSDTADAGHLRFQYNGMQLLCSAIFGYLTAGYAFTLPRSTSPNEKNGTSAPAPGLAASLKLMFSSRGRAVFLCFVILSGVCLQISNGFATPFITHFSGLSEYAGTLASGNATMLFSLSQISEAACILLVGVALKKSGIRYVYALGLAAWGLRFLFLGLGNPGDGLWMLISSMLVYGIAFNFITIAGHLHIQQVSPEGMKGFAQGLMMFMSNGIGATFGTVAAGYIVNRYCTWEMVRLPGSDAMMRLFMGDWTMPWLIFALYAFAAAGAWFLLFRSNSKSNGVS